MSVTTQRTLEDSRVDDENIVHNDVNKMLKLTRLAATFSAAAITVFGFSGLAVAKNQVGYVEVGQDTAGSSVFLDLSTIRGTNYKLFSQYGTGGLFEASLKASCAERRLFITQTALYSSGGQTLSKDRTRTEVSLASPDSPANTSMRFVCKQYGALGW